MNHAHSRKLFPSLSELHFSCNSGGSGIMAERLAAGNTAIALLGNTISTRDFSRTDCGFWTVSGAPLILERCFLIRRNRTHPFTNLYSGSDFRWSDWGMVRAFYV